MATYVLPVGIGRGWALSEVQIEAKLVERRDGCTLYRLLDGSDRHILHIEDEDNCGILEVSETGRRRISLSEALNLTRA